MINIMLRYNAQKRIIFLETLAQTKKRDYYILCAPNGTLTYIAVWKSKHRYNANTKW